MVGDRGTAPAIATASRGGSTFHAWSADVPTLDRMAASLGRSNFRVGQLALPRLAGAGARRCMRGCVAAQAHVPGLAGRLANPGRSNGEPWPIGRRSLADRSARLGTSDRELWQPVGRRVADRDGSRSHPRFQTMRPRRLRVDGVPVEIGRESLLTSQAHLSSDTEPCRRRSLLARVAHSAPLGWSYASMRGPGSTMNHFKELPLVLLAFAVGCGGRVGSTGSRDMHFRPGGRIHFLRRP